MTKAKRRIWAATNRDLAAANHGRMSRHHTTIPPGSDPAAKLEAVKAAAKHKNKPQLREDYEMHDAVRKELIQRLQRLTADERLELMDAAAAENTAEAGKDAAADAVSHFLRPRKEA